MRVSPVSTLALSDFEVRILLYAFPRLTRWSHTDLSAPYWRFYWNSSAGAWLEFAGRRYTLDPGMLTLVPAHTACASCLDRGVGHLNIHFTLHTDGAPSPPGIIQAPLSKEGLMRVRTLGRRIRTGPACRGLDVMALAVVADALLAVPDEGWPVSPMDGRVRGAVRRIEQEPGASVTVAQLAREAGMSEGGFIRLFTRHAGIPPRAYHMRARIAKSCRLLAQTDLSIDQIAERCGFWDRNYFTRIFKRMSYTTPAAFRRQRQEPAPPHT